MSNLIDDSVNLTDSGTVYVEQNGKIIEITYKNTDLISHVTSGAIAVPSTLVSIVEVMDGPPLVLPSLAKIPLVVKGMQGSLVLAAVGGSVSVVYDVASGESPEQAAISRGFGTVAGVIASTLAMIGISALSAPVVVVCLGGAVASFIVSEGVNSIIDFIFEYENDTIEYMTPRIFVGHAPISSHLAKRFANIKNWQNASVVKVEDDTCIFPFLSPIVLDIDGDGMETIGVDDSRAMFDLDGDGTRNLTGWVAPDDGLLVYDRNGDGTINDGRELFGDATLKYDGSGNCLNGFEALAQEDTNGDGVVNASDDNWQHLKVWRDLNQDGRTDAGELFSLEELGITDINVAYENSTTETENGTVLQGSGTYVDVNGDSHSLTDAWFEQDVFYSEIGDPTDIPENLQGLPNINGSGRIGTLLQACAANETLEELLNQFVAADSPIVKHALIEEILFQWAATSGMLQTVEARIDGLGYDFEQRNIPQGDIAWDRKLHVIEAFNGRYLVNMPTDPPPTSYNHLVLNWAQTDVNTISSAYDSLFNFVYDSLMFQTSLSGVMDLIDFDIDMETLNLSLDFSQVYQFFSDELTENKLDGLYDLAVFNRNIRLLLDELGLPTTAIFDFERLMCDTVSNIEIDSAILNFVETFDFLVASDDGSTVNGTLNGDFIFGMDDKDYLHGNGGKDVIYGANGDDHLYGEAGNDYLDGGAGDDTLDGGTDNDILDGGAGDDSLTGGAGNDVFIFKAGNGNDSVNAYDLSSSRYDIIRLVGLSSEDVVFGNSFSGQYQNLTVRIKETGETLTILYGVDTIDYSRYHIQAVEFGDGTVWTYAELLANGLHGTDANDTIYIRDALNGSLYGEGGNDTLHGGSKDDSLFGGAGNDALSGNDGNDVLDGGVGNDTLTGGAGDDTYLFSHGSGQDTINNAGGGNDLLKFEDIDPIELWFGKSGQHLTIGLVATQDQVTISNWFASADHSIETIQAGSETLEGAQLSQLLQAMASVGNPAGVNGQWTDEQQLALAPILSTYWQPLP